MWFFIALLGYFLLAVVFILDKFILTKSLSKPAVYTFYSTIFLFGALALIPFGVQSLNQNDWLWALASGLGFGFGLWTLFIALKHGEASHVDPFNGAAITIATFVLSSMVLGEQLSQFQLMGLVLLLFASFLLSFEMSQTHRGFHIGFFWAAVSGCLFAISHVSAKYLYEIYPFLTGFVWTRAAIGVVGLVTLFFPSVRSALKKRTPSHVPKTEARRHAVLIVIVTKMLAIASVVLIQYAMSLGSVTLVSAMSGFQFIMMFVLILILTKLAPRVFHEYFTRREIMVEIVGILFVMVGSALVVF